MKNVLKEITTCILFVATCVMLYITISMASIANAHEFSKREHCEFLMLLKAVVVVQQDSSWLVCMHALERPDVFTEERQQGFCNVNQSRAAFVNTVQGLLEEGECGSF